MKTTAEKINAIYNVLADGQNGNAKMIRSDRGLIERMESQRTILTEEGRELLRD